MLQEVVGTLLVAFSAWFMLKVTSLPELYHHISNKRGIPVKSLRRLEKYGLKAVKLRLDKQYFESCLDLGLYPPKFKLKDTKLSSFHDDKEIHLAVVREQLKAVHADLRNVQNIYSKNLKEIAHELSLVERTCLNSMLNKFYKEKTRETQEQHKGKLLKLWSSKVHRSPNCIINLSRRELSVHENVTLCILVSNTT